MPRKSSNTPLISAKHQLYAVNVEKAKMLIEAFKIDSVNKKIEKLGVGDNTEQAKKTRKTNFDPNNIPKFESKSKYKHKNYWFKKFVEKGTIKTVHVKVGCKNWINCGCCEFML